MSLLFYCNKIFVDHVDTTHTYTVCHTLCVSYIPVPHSCLFCSSVQVVSFLTFLSSLLLLHQHHLHHNTQTLHHQHSHLHLPKEWGWEGGGRGTLKQLPWSSAWGGVEVASQLGDLDSDVEECFVGATTHTVQIDRWGTWGIKGELKEERKLWQELESGRKEGCGYHCKRK